eukprot:CAMPEP_0172725000 /NCGR_PEP_ID=MMETSP1074-20121228/87353_1 /TAXON_ID=2916 /ORGANISM="Ceratium fusus, Strain PA161109" /LENGTH=481 /DNA_ID=CAMNT_0013551663 /DNA_START=37 /DNA_END=1479 /DNA_ORIENTATION=+
MHGTQETGVDFIHRVSSEIKLVQEEIKTIKGAIEDIQSAIKSETKVRESEVVRLNDKIAHERSLEAQLRTILENRLEDIEGKTKNWVGALGKDLGAIKNLATALETSLGERVAEHKAQVAHDDKRFWFLEQELPKKSTVAQLQTLEAEVSHLRTSTHRDLAAANAAIQAGEASATRDFKMAQDQIGRLQTVVDESKKALVADLSNLARKLDSVEAFTQTRAKATDLQALEPRVFDSEKSIDRLGQEMSTKACGVEVQTISGRLSSLTMDIHANQARSQADKEVVQAQIASIDSGLEKANRQSDIDRDRISQQVSGLERELSTKASRAEVEIIGPSVLSTATDKIDKRALLLEQQISVSRHESAQELLPFKTRLEGLEVAFPTRADVVDIQRLTLSISDSSSRHEASWRRAQEHGMRIDKIEGSINNHALKHEALESRSNSLHQAISKKADATEHFTKDSTNDLLKDFYRKEEVDALLSRVW